MAYTTYINRVSHHGGASGAAAAPLPLLEPPDVYIFHRLNNPTPCDMIAVSRHRVDYLQLVYAATRKATDIHALQIEDERIAADELTPSDLSIGPSVGTFPQVRRIYTAITRIFQSSHAYKTYNFVAWNTPNGRLFSIGREMRICENLLTMLDDAMPSPTTPREIDNFTGPPPSRCTYRNIRPIETRPRKLHVAPPNESSYSCTRASVGHIRGREACVRHTAHAGDWQQDFDSSLIDSKIDKVAQRDGAKRFSAQHAQRYRTTLQGKRRTSALSMRRAGIQPVLIAAIVATCEEEL